MEDNKNNTDLYGFKEMMSFLSDYSGMHYIEPEKGGDKTDIMLEKIKGTGRTTEVY